MRILIVLGGALLLIGALATAGATPALAQDAGESLLEGLDVAAGSEGAGFDTTETDAAVIIANLINALLGVSGIIFLIMLIYAGFLYMTAAGREDMVKKAKKLIGSSIIGLIIISTAFAISDFVIGALIDAVG